LTFKGDATAYWHPPEYAIVQKQTVHCLTVRSVHFISAWLAAAWMPANSDKTVVDVEKSPSMKDY